MSAIRRKHVPGEPCPNETEEAHPCPFQQEVHGNDSAHCRCCLTCEDQCRDNI